MIFLETKDRSNIEPLASEIYADLKASNKFKEKVIMVLAIIIIVLIVALTVTNIYHEYQWSQFDTVVVDSGDGYANYIGGDNGGGIYNGESSSAQAKENFKS